MIMLQDTTVYNAFLTFVVSQTQNAFSAMGIDHRHEQLNKDIKGDHRHEQLNKDVKVDGGTIGQVIKMDGIWARNCTHS